MAVLIYNTLTGRKEVFEPRRPGSVHMYNCGPTVYDYFHVGNLRTFLFFDVVRGWLTYRGYRVRYVQNFTDIDDKLIQRAAERGISVKELADEQIQAYFEDADALGIVRADVHPRVSEKIPQIIQLIQGLIDRGYAYVAGNDVFYDVTRFPAYGKLSRQRIDQLLAGARVERSELKRNPLDFALWKGRKPGEPAWDSPWGPGRPGWHIECSAMALDELGDTLDIHSGGSDLIFPHHENEIAQSEAATGQPFVRYWMHVALVQVEGQRMGKSLGNFWRVRDLRKRFHPDAIRLFILSAHYRNPLEFSLEALEQAEKARQRLYNLLDHLDHLRRTAAARTSWSQAASWQQRLAQAQAQFEQAMDDDFNTADAMAALFTLARDAHKNLSEESSREAIEATYSLFLRLGEPLRLFRPYRQPATAPAAADAQPLLDLLVEVRSYARAMRDYELADRIRNRLEELGYRLEDTPTGTRVRRVAGGFPVPSEEVG